MTDAQGLFTLDSIERPILMIGTGTGVAPFRAMLLARDQRGEELPATRLLFGMRTEQGLLYRQDFERLESKQPQFRYVPTLSRARDFWAGRRGYVQLHVPELVRELGGDCDVYVCGLNDMIRTVRQVLRRELGLPRERVHTERYD